MNTSRASDKHLHYCARVQPHGHTVHVPTEMITQKQSYFFIHCKATATLVQLGRRLFLQHSTAYRSSPEQLNEYFKTVLHNWDGYAGTELYLLLSFPAKNLDKGQSDISAVRCCVMYYFLIWGATLGLVVELLPHWLWYPVCRSSSASASGPGEDLFQQTAKVLTLTSSYKESFHHKFDFVSNCDAHECLSSGAVIQAWDAHSWMALKAH